MAPVREGTLQREEVGGVKSKSERREVWRGGSGRGREGEREKERGLLPLWRIGL